MLTMKAEYVAYAIVDIVVMWIRCFVAFLLDFGLIPIARYPIPLKTDSTNAICLSKDPQLHQRGKHIKQKWKFICE